MAVNPDPKPGRWILPLVILGMVAFTYFFVRELPEASPDTTPAGAQDTTTTTGPTGTTLGGGGNGGVTLDPEVQTYVDELDAINGELQVLRTEMVAVNDGFDADPREVEYSDAVSRLEALTQDAQALSDRVDGLTVPPDLQVNQDVLSNAISVAAGSAADALDGLQSSDTGQLRRSAAEGFTTAADDFDTEVTNAHNAAEAASS